MSLCVLMLSILAGACLKDRKIDAYSPENQGETQILKKQIHDSIRTMNASFVKNAIQKGDAYRQKGELAQSASFYQKAIFLADSIQTSKDDYVPLYGGLAATYSALHDFEQSKLSI